ncbi:SRPBCC family protein [Pseudidiomarina terrestris]|uniref:SRPBCC family protein n=1 Tax=Pseudidiomarina terrestris TaxID=2820060 RepID=UPI00264DBCB1|nr:hypothetical protein [Pseudidiomarina sp. 1ASP75-5]MDN7135152.1 hypothetical protein [Pseudidiomarina sp. 1ASP75-5]
MKTSLFKSSLVIIAACLTPQAVADVIDSSASGFTLTFKRELAAEPMQAYKALTDGIGNWWLAAHTWYGDSSNMRLTATLNGCLCEVSDQGETEHLRVVKVEPGKLIRLTGGLGPLQAEGLHGVMDWRLATTDDGRTSVITVYYRVGGYSPNDLSKWAPAVDNVLQQQMDSLQSYLLDL